MKNFSTSFLTRAMSIAILVIIAITVLVIAFLPWIVKWYVPEASAKADWGRTMLMVVLYPCGVLAALTEWEGYKVFRYLKQNNPFVRQNVVAFKRVAVYLFCISVMLLVKVFTLNTLMPMFGTFAFFVVGLLMLIVSDVFNQAVIYKEDNDLTI